MMCFHDRMKQFTFSEDAGEQTIKMCLDCTSFDAHRVAVLKTGTVAAVDMKTQARWDIILDNAGLGEDIGKYDWLVYEADVSGNTDQLPQVTRTLYTPLDDHLWQERLTPFSHSRSMPRLLTNFCVQCKAYLPVNHLCEVK